MNEENPSKELSKALDMGFTKHSSKGLHETSR